MTHYSNVILSIDLDDDIEYLYEKAKSILKTDGQLKLLHVMHPIESVYFGTPVYDSVVVNSKSFEQDVIKYKKQQLQAVSEKFDLDPEKVILKTGKPSYEIKKYAKENNCDLIVIGSHGKKGFELLLGSTANAVLHGASCDVLAVKVKNTD